MSIATKTGDKGTTALMYNRRVSKCDERVEACGTVDELNAALGVARASSPHAPAREFLASVQRDLFVLMGELATVPEDVSKYLQEGHRLVSTDLISRLDDKVAELESRVARFAGWATPGANPEAAALDLARTICRRAERRVCALQLSGAHTNPDVVVFLNRLSDLLWLLAREAETRA